MGLPRSSYYDVPAVKAGDGEIVAAMTTICDEFEAYGYRRVGAELRHRGMVVNAKKVRRLMREHDLQPKRRRRTLPTSLLRWASSTWRPSLMPGRAASSAMRSAARSTPALPLQR